MEKLTTNEVKQTNKKLLLDFIYRQQRTSKLEIAKQLDLSRPTINQLLNELFELKIIEKNGYYESTGGRKAEAICFVSMARVSIGVELRRHHYEIVALNLYGDIIGKHRFQREFADEDNYYEQVCQNVNSFISSLHISPKRILGIGIVLQGLISADSTTVTYGEILGCTGLTTETFMKSLPYPCRMIHDAEAASLCELRQEPTLKHAVFFHLRTNVSGSIIVNGSFLPGHELKSGVFEHMTLIPEGRSCYCGNKGCVDPYCSAAALLHKNEDLPEFFRSLRSGQPEFAERWNQYLRHLSMAINNIHMFMDYDIILGGTIARYLTDGDLQTLHSYVNKISAFPTSRTFIRISATAHTPISKGAALPFIDMYLNTCI